MNKPLESGPAESHEKDPSKFRSENGIMYTKAIIFEWCGWDKSKAIYSIKNEDHVHKGKTYPSLRRLYLEMGDETEYLFAEKYFLNYPHFLKLQEIALFKQELEKWREELRLRSVAIGLKILHEKALSGDVRAAKELVMRPWEKSSGAGRPSKKSIQSEAMKIVKETSVYDEDFDRILGNA